VVRPKRPLRIRAAALPAGLIATIVAAPRVSATPQWSVAATTGVAAAKLGSNDPHAAFDLGARGDVLLLRSRDADMAIGPYIDMSTTAFATLDFGGGAEWLIPWSTTLPLILSAGPYARHATGIDWSPGIEATIFVGSRSYNFNAPYSMSAGFFVQGRHDFGIEPRNDIVLGVQVDLALLALPFVYAFEALRSP
jgi:hypothetical protein